VGCILEVSTAGVHAWVKAALVRECWRVALSRASGEGVSGMRAQSSSRICRHRGAMGRSHSGDVLILSLSFAYCSLSVEDRRARR